MIFSQRLSEIKDKERFLEDFSNLPEKLYPKFKNPPKDYWKLLITQNKSIHSDALLFYDGDSIIARVGLCVPLEYPGHCFFGCLEYIHEGISDLNLKRFIYSEVEKWAREQEVKEINGPIDYSIWFSYRFKMNETTHQFGWEPQYPKYYFEDALDEGFEVDKKFSSFNYKSFFPMHEYTSMHHREAIREGIRFEDVDVSNPVEINEILELNLDSFKKSYLYTDVDEGQFNSIFIEFIKNEKAKYVYKALNSEGICLGMIYAFQEHGHLVIKTIAISPKYRKKNIGNALLFHCLDQAKRDGLELLTAAMIREGNPSMKFLEHIPDLLEVHNYCLVKKSLVL